jgi:hypothetical protein
MLILLDRQLIGFADFCTKHGRETSSGQFRRRSLEGRRPVLSLEHQSSRIMEAHLRHDDFFCCRPIAIFRSFESRQRVREVRRRRVNCTSLFWRCRLRRFPKIRRIECWARRPARNFLCQPLRDRIRIECLYGNNSRDHVFDQNRQTYGL